MKIELTKKDAELISNCILNQMLRLNTVYCVTKELRELIKKELKELERLNSLICKGM